MKNAISILITLLLGFLIPQTSLAHDPRLDLPEPKSTEEAWSVLNELAGNLDSLVAAGLYSDIPMQVALTTSSLNYLKQHGDSYPKNSAKITQLVPDVTQAGHQLIIAAQDKKNAAAMVKESYPAWKKLLADLEGIYPAEQRKSTVYICPMHPRDTHIKPDDKCSICSMALFRRRIPSSDIYEKPGQPSLKIAVIADPLEVGKSATVKIRFTKSDGTPGTYKDLLEVHTQKIHLLINDLSLSDYHHEHPARTETPGEYVFSFTPAKPGTYRIWADVVPSATSIQEYVVADIPAKVAAATLIEKATLLATVVHGRKYELQLFNQGKPVRAGETVNAWLTITEPDGKPFTKCEPIMAAFAHVVGFSEDLKTVVHLHPISRDPINDADRAGPSFAIKLYFPAAGFVRLYGQVQIDGKSHFARFGLNILPPADAATKPASSPKR